MCSPYNHLLNNTQDDPDDLQAIFVEHTSLRIIYTRNSFRPVKLGVPQVYTFCLLLSNKRLKNLIFSPIQVPMMFYVVKLK